jgi:hypothetical protein
MFFSVSEATLMGAEGDSALEGGVQGEPWFPLEDAIRQSNMTLFVLPHTGYFDYYGRHFPS